MPVTLQVTNGPSNGRKIYVARGQIVKVGRTEWSDVSFPNDASMADIHFEIQAIGSECRILDSSGGKGTLVNEAPVTAATLHTGDEVKAGETSFSIAVEGEAAPAKESAAVIEQDQAKSSAGSSVPMAADYCRSLKISDPAKELLIAGMSPDSFLELVTKNQLYSDAVRFLAFWLPRPVAVAWGCDCVEKGFAGKLTAQDRISLDAARTWAKEPTESNSRAAEKAATQSNFDGAASWIALAAFWSGTSIAPAGLPMVPPGEGLTAEAITGALIKTAALGDPGKTKDRYRAFLEEGRKRLPTNPEKKS